MSQKELARYRVLTLVLEGQLPLQDASEHLGLSLRHTRRLKRRVHDSGPEGLLHGNRGKSPSNRMSQEQRQRILELAGGAYKSFNDTHLCERLAEEENISIGRETLRSLLRSTGKPPKRKRRAPKHHRRRERSPAKGLMVLWDGSPHRWLGDDRPPCTLMAAVDDADSELLDAFFVPAETSQAYLNLLEGIVCKAGIPGSIYQDRHGALKRNDGHWSLEEQLAGQQTPTQVGAALNDLGIRPIFALSPQAKGRIERFFGTAQDRLLAEMTRRGIHDLEAANCYLNQQWIAEYNQRFRKQPKTSDAVYRPTEQLDLKRILAFRYQATVLNDNTVRLGGLILDIPPGPRKRSYAKAKVDVRQHLDGSWSVYYQDRTIAQAEPTDLREPAKARIKTRRRKPAKGADEILWLYLPPDGLTPQDIFHLEAAP